MFKSVSFKGGKFFVNGAKIERQPLAKICGVGVECIRQTMMKDDPAKVIMEYRYKFLAGISQKNTVHYHGECMLCVQVVTKITGVGTNAATDRIREWVKNGDVDRLLRPLNAKRGPSKGTIYKPRKKLASEVVEVEPVEKPSVFDKSKFCIRYKGAQVNRCRHYLICLSHRLEHKKHSSKYEADGNCFRGPK